MCSAGHAWRKGAISPLLSSQTYWHETFVSSSDPCSGIRVNLSRDVSLSLSHENALLSSPLGVGSLRKKKRRDCVDHAIELAGLCVLIRERTAIEASEATAMLLAIVCVSIGFATAGALSRELNP
jgi:hypothetical protein